MSSQYRSIAFLVAGLLLVAGLFFAFRAEAPALPDADTSTATSTATLTPTSSASTLSPATPVVKAPQKGSIVAAPAPVAKVTPTLSGRVAPDLVKPTGFTNIDNLDRLSTDAFTLKYWLGKRVILLEFWTSSSLNSYHTIPYLNRWHEQYKDDGLMIVAVHTPQFSYERSKSVVDQIVFGRQMGFPVVIDNEYGTWGAYKNTVWPHRYLIDLNGRIVYDHAGDGAYEVTESKIVELLVARAESLDKPFVYEKFQVPQGAFVSDLSQLGTKELFFGAARNTTLASGSALKEGPQTFVAPTTVTLNTLALSGAWTFTKEYAQSMTESSAIYARYKAKGVYATLAAETYIPVKVLRDGVPLTEAIAGKDIRFEKGESVFYVKDARVYNLIQDSSYGEHTITLSPVSGGFRAYVLMGE